MTEDTKEQPAPPAADKAEADQILRQQFVYALAMNLLSAAGGKVTLLLKDVNLSLGVGLRISQEPGSSFIRFEMAEPSQPTTPAIVIATEMPEAPIEKDERPDWKKIRGLA